MEVLWDLDSCGFSVAMDGKRQTPGWNTPNDFLAAGWEYVPFLQAPAALQGCYSTKASRITKLYQGRRVIVLMGGLDSPVHYSGLGLVKHGAEREASITNMSASSREFALQMAVAALRTAFVNRVS
jgi:hypothetical protein